MIKNFFLGLALVVGFGVLSIFFYHWYYLSDTGRFYLYYRILPKYFSSFQLPKGKLIQSPLLVQEYIIEEGDSLWNIARKFGRSIDTIVSYNNTLKVHMVSSGKKIQIPTMDGLVHYTKSSDSLEKISSQYQVRPEAIVFFNPNFYEQVTSSNQKIFIPGAYYQLSERLGKLGAEFLKPLKRIYITSLYGFRVHPTTKKRSMHKGIDFRGRIGDKVYAAKGGVVTFAGEYKNFGNLVAIKHKKNYVSRYAHLNSIRVKAGQRISAQTVIGTLGMTGRVTGPHLHFEIWKNGKSINPRGITDLH